MLAVATTAIAWVIFVDHPARLDRLLLRQPQGGAARAGLRGRARSQPQAVLRRRGARGPPPRAGAVARRAAAGRRWSSACRCTGSSSPSRQAGATAPEGSTRSSPGAATCSRPRPRAASTAPAATAPTAAAAQAPYTVTDPNTGEVKCGQLVRAGAEHRAVPLRRERGRVHPRLRPAVLADVAVGPRRRRPDERPADRDADRLRSASRSRCRCPRERLSPANEHRRPRICASGTLPEDEQDRHRRGRHCWPRRSWSTPASTPRSTRRWARRCSTSTSTAAPTRCARCHTQGWSYGEPQVTGQGAFGWNLTGGSPAAHFPERGRT